MRARIAQLEANVTELQGNLATQEAATQRAITSDSYMLAEVQRAAEQLLCKHSNLSARRNFLSSFVRRCD